MIVCLLRPHEKIAESWATVHGVHQLSSALRCWPLLVSTCNHEQGVRLLAHVRDNSLVLAASKQSQIRHGSQLATRFACGAWNAGWGLKTRCSGLAHQSSWLTSLYRLSHSLFRSSDASVA